MSVYWINLVLGIWIVVSPWVLGASANSLMLWGSVIAGLVIVLVNLWAIFASSSASDASEVKPETAGANNKNGNERVEQGV